MSKNINEEKIDDKVLDKLEEFDYNFKVTKICGISCNIFDFKKNPSSQFSFETNKCLGLVF